MLLRTHQRHWTKILSMFAAILQFCASHIGLLDQIPTEISSAEISFFLARGSAPGHPAFNIEFGQRVYQRLQCNKQKPNLT